ncbi:uncharacterized protein LOC134250605 [Saccostrea cucullata]|uniref:uncharacterized protein LOC134250605 n=1 Tax=Saccostrea cuccullata TaxID=36930 RepID=UPI002ED04E34
MWRKVGIQHASESVFVRLCYKLGFPQQVIMRREIVDIDQILRNQMTLSRDEDRMMASGSSREGFRLKESDVDVMRWPNDHMVIWELNQAQNYDLSRKTLIICDCSDSPPGFSLLELLTPTHRKYLGNACIRINSRLYVSSSKYRQITCSKDVPNSKEHGPCSSGVKWGTEYDHAHCLACDFWPPPASQWIDRYFDKKFSDEDKLLCSYHMKTAVFWVIQQNTIPHWHPQNLLESFWVCFKLILKWVYEGVCPNFFIPENNMFLSNIHGEAQKNLFIHLHEFYEKGITSLLRIPSIRSSFPSVHLNPRQFVATDVHILTSRVLLEVTLFHELFVKNLPAFNLHRCMRFFNALEKLISSHLTKNQILILRKFTVTVLQNIAFMLYNCL